tara:strand:+ start:220 stop:651 length:432 start_codon:yes stop_codon:yes gene_type:complete
MTTSNCLELTLVRFKCGDRETIGRLTVPTAEGVKLFWTIENPWVDNETNISCIPEGFYYLERYDSPTHGDGTWQFVDVPKRSYCQIHVANYARNVQGCIGLGNTLMEELSGVGSSRDAMAEFDTLTADYDELRMVISSGSIPA